MRRQPVRENTVVAQIVARLKKFPGVAVRKRHGTVMGVAGDPDLYGTIRGRHFEIEVKRPNDRRSQLTQIQAANLLKWKLAGAITGVARSVDEALAILGLNRPETVWICAGCSQYRWQGDEPPARCPNCGHIHFDREAADV
jgi:hypothetical protein